MYKVMYPSRNTSAVATRQHKTSRSIFNGFITENGMDSHQSMLKVARPVKK